MDPAEHREMTGSDNRLILDNARRLIAAAAPVSFRMPVVPGITDREPNLRHVATFLHDLEAPRIHLLRYHAMGEAKLPRIASPLPPLGLAEPQRAAERFAYAADFLTRQGLEVMT